MMTTRSCAATDSANPSTPRPPAKPARPAVRTPRPRPGRYPDGSSVCPDPTRSPIVTPKNTVGDGATLRAETERIGAMGSTGRSIGRAGPPRDQKADAGATWAGGLLDLVGPGLADAARGGSASAGASAGVVDPSGAPPQPKIRGRQRTQPD